MVPWLLPSMSTTLYETHLLGTKCSWCVGTLASKIQHMLSLVRQKWRESVRRWQSHRVKVNKGLIRVSGFASSSVYIPHDLAPAAPQGASIVRWSPSFIKQSGASLTVCGFHSNRESGPSKRGNSSPSCHGHALSLATGLWLESL